MRVRTLGYLNGHLYRHDETSTSHPVTLFGSVAALPAMQQYLPRASL
jgi:hypothetical protein